MIGKSLIASFIMGLVIFFIRLSSVNLFILIPTGVIVYFTFIYLLKALPKEDYQALRNLAHNYTF